MSTPPTPIDHNISLETAAAWTKNYRTAHPGEVKAMALPKADFMEIMAQEECEYVRIYFAINDEGEKQCVAVGVDSEMNDLYNGVLKDRMFGSPPHGGNANPLNSNV